VIARNACRTATLIAAALLASATGAAAQSSMIESIYNAEGSNFGVAFIKTKETSKEAGAGSFGGTGVEIRAVYPNGSIYLSGVSLQSPRGEDEPAATLGFEWLPLTFGRVAGGLGGFGTMTQVDGPDGKQAWLTLGGGASAYLAVTKSFWLGVSYNLLNSDLDGSRSQLVARFVLVP